MFMCVCLCVARAHLILHASGHTSVRDRLDLYVHSDVGLASLTFGNVYLSVVWQSTGKHSEQSNQLIEQKDATLASCV